MFGAVRAIEVPKRSLLAVRCTNASAALQAKGSTSSVISDAYSVTLSLENSVGRVMKPHELQLMFVKAFFSSWAFFPELNLLKLASLVTGGFPTPSIEEIKMTKFQTVPPDLESVDYDQSDGVGPFRVVDFRFDEELEANATLNETLFRWDPTRPGYSWLSTVKSHHGELDLIFGSAIQLRKNPINDALMSFHQIYSKVLLHSAMRQFQQDLKQLEEERAL